MSEGRRERDGVEGTPDRPAEPSATAVRRRLRGWWWGPALFGGALTLLLAAALSPWADRLFGELDAAPWWLAATAALAGLAAWTGPTRGALLASVAAALGVLAYVQGGGREAPAELFASPVELARSVTPLAVTCLCLLAAGLCLLLARRQESWLPPATLAGPHRRARRLTAVLATGGLLGGLLGVGGGYAAQALQRAWADEPSRVDATSSPAPPAQRADGIELTPGQYRDTRPFLAPTAVLWQAKLPGPAAPTTCLLDQAASDSDDDTPPVARGTLVSVDPGDDASAVIGYDTADGTERWRYTVRHPADREVVDAPDVRDHPGRLGQVGVSELCTVHVVADERTLVTLDGDTGEVLRETPLPPAGERFADPTRNWMFLTGTHPIATDPGEEGSPFDWRPVIALGHGTGFFLASPDLLLELAQPTGEVVSVGRDQQECRRSVTPVEAPAGARPSPDDPRPLLLTQGCALGGYSEVPAPPGQFDPDDADSPAREPHRAPTAPFRQVSTLGCEEAPRIADFGGTMGGALLTGTWCRDRAYLLAETSASGDFLVAELPAGTEPPLRPMSARGTEFEAVWLDGGTLYGLHRHGGEQLHTEGGQYYRAGAYGPVETGAEPLEAVLVGEVPGTLFPAPLLAYAVTASGDVLALEQDGVGVDEQGEVVWTAAAEPAMTPYAELPGVADTCAGDRRLTVDRAGLNLLTWCETPDGAVVTAIAAERPS
ncbi:hypothetical protein RM844_20220 [Streptomyces sp. DSM 44915]|uniref:PQQ-binding-like beta-propeller repeat protein n=1 Tax=Streptomyces chisholmiae TaxID=3075540 RepID=A0ABU2JV42_9ACTN|nr:hypothetical protein [Streptomyces sp. DSM 44915]MDT0268614.1 hypothetical protein [Streptomyces sp. DSM 44915]